MGAHKVLEIRYPQDVVLELYKQGCSTGEIVERFQGKKHDTRYLGRLITEAGLMRSPVERMGIAFGKGRIPRPSGKKHWKFKGYQKEKAGYILLYQGQGKYVRRSRLVWEQANGPIPEGSEVHHLNGIKNDDRPENLVALTKKGHTRIYLRLLEKAQQRIRELEGQLKKRKAQLKLDLGTGVG